MLASTSEGSEEIAFAEKNRWGVIGISVAAVFMSISVKYKNENAKLAQAALDGKLGEVERLLTGGMDVNARASQNLTALMAASNKGDTEIVRNMLEAGADANIASDNGGFALMDASWNGHLTVVSAAGQWQRQSAGQSRDNGPPGRGSPGPRDTVGA